MAYQHPKRPRKSGDTGEIERTGMTSMQGAVKAFLRASGLDEKLRDWPVYDAWNQVVGEQMARRAQPVRFQAGDLLIEVESAPHMQELKQFTGERYRILANERLGRERIRRVVFKLKR